MAKDQIMVEINLSSNDYILNVKGENHPLSLYLKSGVHIALSTDDEGVSRENLTVQFQRAVTDNHISYPELKKMVRNSLFFAFVSGENLWQNASYEQRHPACEKDNPQLDTLSASCDLFLQKNQKATLQWQLEKQFYAFEVEQASIQGQSG
jgi:adenosine deaminase